MFDTIGEGHKIMHEGAKKEIDLDELEKLAAQATPGPWEVDDCHNIRVAPKGRPLVATIHDDEDYLPRMADAQYIVAACNALPDLITENRELREKVKMMDWQLVWLAKEVCDSLSPQEWINRAEKAAKEAGE